ncbi:MAG: hypothetical protein KJ066_04685 [Acidobacteria bacterium]|nr:hypothetical protein [Acidobacteriota bacterium]
MSHKVRTEARGAHWVAWIETETPGKPLDAVLLVGRSEADAEDAARQWLAKRPAPRPA